MWLSGPALVYQRETLCSILSTGEKSVGSRIQEGVREADHEPTRKQTQETSIVVQVYFIAQQ